jgi:hypothetical protein
MKRVLHVFTFLTIVLLFVSFRTTKAQGQVIQTWDFETAIDNWASGDGNPGVSTSTDKAYFGTHSLKVVASGSAANATIQNDAYKPLAGDIITYHVWVSAADTANLLAAQIFYQDGGSAWTWETAAWINGFTLKGDTWNTLTCTMKTIAPTLDRMGIQLIGKNSSLKPVYYIDGITVKRLSSLVSSWGASTARGASWPILNTLTTPAGSASMGSSTKLGGWATLRGQFDAPLTTTTSQAVVVTGTFEYVGGGAGSAYTWLRYAIMGDDGTGVLSNQYTPTAGWTFGASAAGYQWDPVSGSGQVSNGSGGGTGASGTMWLCKNANWNSTNSNGGGPLGPIVQQAPFRAIATAGVYNWAISVQALSNGTNEIRYYFEKQHAAGVQTTYWFGGTIIDPTPVKTTFNSINFGVNSDVDATTTQVNIGNVTAVLGAPITVTEAPFQSFYVNQWGTTPRGSNWPILNDSTYVDGNGSMGGTKAPAGWASIRGGFQQSVIPTLTKAMVVTGSFEFVGGGGGNSYTWLRYAIMGDSGAVLSNQNKPTAAWTEGSAKRGGYEWDPVSGAGTVANGSGGGTGASGTLWLVKTSSWTSTNSNGGGPIGGIVLPAPARAIATAGVYDFAISVQPLADGTNQVRYYFIKHAATGAQTTYWFGGTAIDPNPVQKAFNYIGFAVNSDVDATCKQVNITNVKVDLTNPITVPDAPWQAYYLSSWGFFGGKNGGSWKYSTDGIVGDGSISGKTGPAGWAAIRGGFVGSVKPTTAKAIIVKGNMELVGGGFEAWSSLNIGLFYTPNPGTVDTSGGLSTAKWNGTDANEYGYLITPRSDKLPNETYGLANMATVGAIVNQPWLSTSGTSPFDTSNHNFILSSNTQNPVSAVGTAGMYDFAFSVQPLANGRNEITYQIQKQDKTYNFAGIIRDNISHLKLTQFNGIHFATNNPTTTAIKLTNVLVDLGAPITISNSYSLTSVNSNGSEIPANYELSQNYPNPFNPTTNIQFSLPKNSNVKLVVYDILGRVVSQLVDKDLTAGNYKINFNASNLASGTYFYSLHAGDFVSVKKLMLVK